MSEATVGSIVGFLRLDTSAWRRELDEAEARARQLGGSSPDIRIRTNSAAAVAQLGAVSAAERNVGDSASKATPPTIGLVGAIASLAPAAVPIAAVAGGAMLGLVPVAATALLGIKGIVEQYKSGALAGTTFGKNVAVLQTEFTKLKTISAGGLMAGLNQSMSALKPLFGVLNGDAKVMSAQLGLIVSHVAPGLVSIFTQLNPLFVTFGNLLVNGAGRLEHWATSTTGIHSFVAYVQSALPSVMNVLGGLVTLFSHIAQAAAPMGGVILGGLGILVRVLDAIPVNVLQILIPLLEATYVGFKAFQGITFLVSSMKAVGAAFAFVGTSAAASSAAVTLATAEAAAASAAEAVTITADQLLAAEGVAAAAATMAASLAGTGSILEETAAAAAVSSAEEVVAFRAAAAAAVTSAAEMDAAAAAAAEGIVAAGDVAKVGWMSMLGPIGAVIVGVGVLASVFMNSSHKTQDAAKAMDSYTESVKQSTDTLAAANVQQTVTNLAKNHALSQLDKLSAGNHSLGLSYGDLTTAVNGTDKQFNDVVATLDGVIKANTKLGVDSRGHTTTAISDEGEAAISLRGKLGSLREGLGSAVKAQLQLDAAMKDAQTAANGGASATAAQAKALGMTTDEYLAAQSAAQKNTDAIKKQTDAMVIANDAAGLLKQAFDALDGKTLDVNDANVAFHAKLIEVAAQLKANKGVMDLNTQAGVDDNKVISDALRLAQQHAQAISHGTQLTAAGTAAYIKDLQAIREHVKGVGGDTAAIDALIRSVQKIPPHKLTKIELDKAAAEAARQAWLHGLSGIPPVKYTRVELQTALAAQQLQQLRNDASYPVTIPVRIGAGPLANKPMYGGASGGTIPGADDGTTVAGSGTSKSDSNLYWLSKGEEIIQEPSASKYRKLLKAINADSFADGGTAGRGYAGGGTVNSLMALINKAGFHGAAAQTMYGIVMAESGGNARALNNNPGTGDLSYGLAQINMIGSMGPARLQQYGLSSNASLFDPLTNLRVAYQLSGGGTHFGDWSTYNSGAYQQFAGQGGAQVTGGGGSGGARSAASIAAAHAKAVVAAHEKAMKAIQQLRASHGGASGVASALRHEIPEAKAASHELGAAVANAFNLKGIDTKLAAAKAALAAVLASAKTMADSVTGTLSGSVDPTKYADLGGMLSAYQNQTGVNQTFRKETGKLGKEGLNKTLLQQLMMAGPSAGLDTLAGASKAQIAQVNKSYSDYMWTASRGGGEAATSIYGTTIAKDKAAAAALTAQQTAVMRKIDNLVMVIAKTTHRPVQINLDGKVLAKAVFKSNEFEGVLDEITHKLVYGHA